MAWIVLVVSGVLEAVWATALGKSEGLSRLVPSIVFFVAPALSMGGLAYAMRSLPIGTAYAVWVGIGAVLTTWAICVPPATVSPSATVVEPSLKPQIPAVPGLFVCGMPGRPCQSVPQMGRGGC